MTDELPLEWRARIVALAPAAALIPKERVSALSARWKLSILSGLATNDHLVLLGSGDELPWAPGARYFGKDPRAPQLLLPTTLEPTLPLELVARAVAREFGDHGPWLVDVSQRWVVSLGGAGRIDRRQLERWLGADDAASS